MPVAGTRTVLLLIRLGRCGLRAHMGHVDGGECLSSMRRQLAGAALFLVLAVVELWTPLTHGGTLMAADLGQLWPLTRAPGPLLPAIPLESDGYTQLMPFIHFAVAQVRAGHLPTWNPYNGNGQPFLANYQSALFSPFTAPFYVAGFRVALILSALARLWLLGFFTFLFLRRHRLGDLAAVVGAVIFMFAGYHIVWLNYPITSVSAWLPLSLWSARVALDHRGGDKHAGRTRTLASVGLVVSVAARLVGGNPATATFDILLLVDVPTFPGCHVKVRPVACFIMSDESGRDVKILGVPAKDVRYERYQELNDVPTHIQDEVEHFFSHYKDLEPGKSVTIEGWRDLAQAHDEIEASVKRYQH